MTDNNKVVVITGGNRGIGADITRRFLDSGYLVVNISRQTPEFSTNAWSTTLRSRGHRSTIASRRR